MEAEYQKYYDNNEAPKIPSAAAARPSRKQASGLDCHPQIRNHSDVEPCPSDYDVTSVIPCSSKPGFTGTEDSTSSSKSIVAAPWTTLIFPETTLKNVIV